jgi:ankyrin repeat protein
VQFGKTPLFWAAENGHAAVLRLLLERGALVDAKSKVRTPVVPRSVGACSGVAAATAFLYVASVPAAAPLCARSSLQWLQHAARPRRPAARVRRCGRAWRCGM